MQECRRKSNLRMFFLELLYFTTVYLSHDSRIIVDYVYHTPSSPKSKYFFELNEIEKKTKKYMYVVPNFASHPIFIEDFECEMGRKNCIQGILITTPVVQHSAPITLDVRCGTYLCSFCKFVYALYSAIYAEILSQILEVCKQYARGIDVCIAVLLASVTDCGDVGLVCLLGQFAGGIFIDVE